MRALVPLQTAEDAPSNPSRFRIPRYSQSLRGCHCALRKHNTNSDWPRRPRKPLVCHPGAPQLIMQTLKLPSPLPGERQRVRRSECFSGTPQRAWDVGRMLGFSSGDSITGAGSGSSSLAVDTSFELQHLKARYPKSGT